MDTKIMQACASVVALAALSASGPSGAQMRPGCFDVPQPPGACFFEGDYPGTDIPVGRPFGGGIKCNDREDGAFFWNPVGGEKTFFKVNDKEGFAHIADEVTSFYCPEDLFDDTAGPPFENFTCNGTSLEDFRSDPGSYTRSWYTGTTSHSEVGKVSTNNILLFGECPYKIRSRGNLSNNSETIRIDMSVHFACDPDSPDAPTVEKLCRIVAPNERIKGQ